MDTKKSTSAKCGQCGAQVPPGAPEGLCPRCLMLLNLSGDTTMSGGADGTEQAAPTRRAPPLEASEVARLFPALEIIEFLGHGGMGAVYKARHPRLDRLVALKLLLPEKDADPLFAERFEREAKALARLNHSEIVAVYDFGEVQGHFYLLMEYVDGVTLRQLLRAGQMAPAEALALVPHICEALQYAHDQGIVHRDIKPENILIDKQGRVKIADFGIAKIVGGTDDQPALTGGGQVVGTPHYMAPEQIEKPRTVDHRADIYSLGVVFYEMLTGELPLGKFPAPSSRLHGLGIEVRLDEIVLRALEKEPARRYQQAGNVKTDVETLTADSSRTPRSPVEFGADSAPPRPVRLGAGRDLKLLAIVAACLLGLGLGWLVFHHRGEPRLTARVDFASEQASVQDILQELARQVGLGYDRETSFARTDPLCRQWVNHVTIKGKSCREALDQILKPCGLGYQIDKGSIVLSRLPPASPLAAMGPEPPKLAAARLALTGARKKTAEAKALLLELVGKDHPTIHGGWLCYAYVYLGYIEDGAGNRQEAVGWFKRAAEIPQADPGIRECAEYGLKQPLKWIRHLDAD